MNEFNPTMTPLELAKRWKCTTHHIATMIRRGDLPAFKIGPKLWRIPTAVVEDAERCRQNSDSSCSEATTMPLGRSPTVSDVFPYEPVVVKMPNVR